MEQPFLDIFPDSKIGILVCKGIDNHIKEEDKYEFSINFLILSFLDVETSFSINFCKNLNLLFIAFFSSIELINSFSFFNLEIKFLFIL